MTRSRGVCRKPTLADLLILIAAMGVGFGIMRPWIALFGPMPYVSLFEYAAHSLYLSAPCGAAMTLGWMAIRWRMPRPDRLRLMRQPGLVACCSFLFNALIVFTLAMARVFLRINPTGNGVFETTCGVVPRSAGHVVLISWGLLLLSGRWRREPGWIDATGILLGIYWILINFYVSFFGG